MIIQFPDVTVTGNSEYALVHPRTEKARKWVIDNVAVGARYEEDALVVDYTVLDDLIEGMRFANLEVRA